MSTYRVKSWLKDLTIHTFTPSDIIHALLAAHKGSDINQLIGTKVEAGVLVSQKLFDKFISSYGTEFLEQLYIDHNINLFGTQCHCPIACPPSRVFLDARPCSRKMIFSIMLLNCVLLPELTREICKMLLLL